MIYLASKSPRRQALLQQIHIEFKLLAIDIDESIGPNEPPGAYVQRLALEKARKGVALLPAEDVDTPVLGADTVIVIDGRILGKPKDEKEGVEMLQQLSGRRHQVITAVAILDKENEKLALSSNEVTFRELSLSEIQLYWQTGEPADKAGGYGIQGIGAIFIQHLSGSYSGVMGLPLYETSQLLAEL